MKGSTKTQSINMKKGNSTHIVLPLPSSSKLPQEPQQHTPTPIVPKTPSPSPSPSSSPHHPQPSSLLRFPLTNARPAPITVCRKAKPGVCACEAEVPGLVRSGGREGGREVACERVDKRVEMRERLFAMGDERFADASFTVPVPSL